MPIHLPNQYVPNNGTVLFRELIMNNLKGVLRSATAMFLFVGLFGIWMGGCQTQEQKEIKRLIKQLQDQNENVRQSAVFALGQIGKDAVPALIQALKKRLHQGIKYFVGPLTLLFLISGHPAQGWSPNIHLMCRRNQIFNC